MFRILAIALLAPAAASAQSVQHAECIRTLNTLYDQKAEIEGIINSVIANPSATNEARDAARAAYQGIGALADAVADQCEAMRT